MALTVTLNSAFFQNINCCIAEMAYKALTQDMFLKPDRFKTFKTVKYLQGLYTTLFRYYNNVDCLTEEEAQSILDQITEICSICGSCNPRFV